MSIPYLMAGTPSVLVLCAAIAVAVGGRPPDPGHPEIKAGTDLGRVRASLMHDAPPGSLAEIAFSVLQGRGLSCKVSKPPLANLTWRIIRCETALSPGGAILLIDVAGRNGVVVDIGVEDPSCIARADIIDPDPEPGGCNISSKRLLDEEARGRAAAAALLANVLGEHGIDPKDARSNPSR